LLSPQNDTLQSYLYSADNSNSISDEKTTINENNFPSNWGNCLTLNGTPGAKNSLTKYQYDLAVVSVSSFPEILLPYDTVTISSVIRNVGSLPAVNFDVTLFNDLNFNGLMDPSEILYQSNSNSLSPDDSLTIQVPTANIVLGVNDIFCFVNFVLDMNTLNNSINKRINVYSPYISFNDIVINEIMYAPLSSMPEWIELYNKSNEKINLKNLSIGDAVSKQKILKDDKFLEPFSYVVVCKDSSILNFYELDSILVIAPLPIFNNSEDAVVLYDSLNLLIDSSYYHSFYGGQQGKSLERVYPDSLSLNQNNWKSSSSFKMGTPGFINSVTPKNKDAALIDFSPVNPYTIINEKNSLQINIKNIGKLSLSNLSLKVFFDANNDSIPQQAEQIFYQQILYLNNNDSTYITNDIIVKSNGVNLFIALLDCNEDEDTLNNSLFAPIQGVLINELRNDLVINEIMYAPQNDDPEWIEIYNRSQKLINLKNYAIADNKDTTQIISFDKVISPNGYLVFSKDSSLLLKTIPDSLVIICSFPQLNNTGDKLIFLDSLNRVIDSLEYSHQWGGNNGRSLERIDVEFTSLDSLNWREAKNNLGFTPGYINSQSQKIHDICVNDFWCSTEFPRINDTVFFFVKINNIGKNAVNFIVELYEDTNLDSIPDSKIESTQSFYLYPNDSITIPLLQTKYLLKSENGFLINAVCTIDEDIDNNKFYKNILSGYPPYSIIINEIMYDSNTDEPEWIELYNNSDFVINLLDWEIKDVFTTPSSAKITKNSSVLPHNYLVIAKDSSILGYHENIPADLIIMNFPILNNDKDGIILRDNRNRTIDSVFFFADWNISKGNSLERFYFDSSSVVESNWLSSQSEEHSTPGLENSIVKKEYDLKLLDIVLSPETPKINDSIEVKIVVENIGQQQADSSNIYVFKKNSINGLDSLLYSSKINAIKPHTKVTFTCPDKFLFDEAETCFTFSLDYHLDQDITNNKKTLIIKKESPPNSILINEIMINPNDDKSEWVELINNSNEKVNLKNWQLSDWLSSPKVSYISSSDYWLEPDDFLIVGNDSSILKIYPNLKERIKISSFGTLNNSADGVFLYNQSNHIIDSVCYDNGWKAKKGVSIERISRFSFSNDSSNWFLSQSPEGNTICSSNSVLSLTKYSQNSIVLNEIMYEASMTSEYLEFLNASPDTVNLAGFRVLVDNKKEHLLTDSNLVLIPGDLFLLAADSSILSVFNELYSNRHIKIIDESSLGLLNNGSQIGLYDFKGTTIDSLIFSPSWHNKNFIGTSDKSLERINPNLNSNNPTNWSTSVNTKGGTPGTQNSIFVNNSNRSSTLTINPNPFSPDNDGHEDFTVINYQLNSSSSQVTIKVFDSKGRLVRILSNNFSSGATGSFIFDGKDEEGNPLRIGIYPILLEAEDENHQRSEIIKAVVVIARKL